MFINGGIFQNSPVTLFPRSYLHILNSYRTTWNRFSSYFALARVPTLNTSSKCLVEIFSKGVVIFARKLKLWQTPLCYLIRQSYSFSFLNKRRAKQGPDFEPWRPTCKSSSQHPLQKNSKSGSSFQIRLFPFPPSRLWFSVLVIHQRDAHPFSFFALSKFSTRYVPLIHNLGLL